MSEKRICHLCGKEITKGKGMNQKAYLQEGIMRKYRISSNEYLNAVLDGLFLLFPDLEETKSLKEYKSRERKAKEEIEEKFPYLKELKEKKKEEEKKEAAKEEDVEEKSV